jgi:hypothetical protein
MSFKDWLRKYSPPLSQAQIEEIATQHEQTAKKAKEATAPEQQKRRK